jgi:hypothetical protein
MTPLYLDTQIDLLDQFYDNHQYILKELDKKIKLDDVKSGCSLPTLLEKNNFIILLKNKNSGEIYSFIWYGYYFNNTYNNYLHVNFSFTFIKFRNKGYNKLLRLQLENICASNNIKYITSAPFDNSPSKIILANLGYLDNKTHFVKRLKKKD